MFLFLFTIQLMMMMMVFGDLQTDTVAAGGGSRLFWRHGLFVTGPESAGAEPGPCCYRKSGPLAITDANLILGRLIPEYFPKIFGENENEGLDEEASRKAFEVMRDQINSDLGEGRGKMSVDEVAWGLSFIFIFILHFFYFSLKEVLKGNK